MDPHGDYLTGFLNKPAVTGATYRAVASNFEPRSGSPLLSTARDGVMDVAFGSAQNDLIVPTEGVYRVAGLDGFTPAEPFVFAADAGVDHSGYWDQPAFAERILSWLPG